MPFATAEFPPSAGFVHCQPSSLSSSSSKQRLQYCNISSSFSMKRSEFPSYTNEKQQLFLATGSGDVRAVTPTTTATTTTRTSNTNNHNNNSQQGDYSRKGRTRQPRLISPTPGAFRIDATGTILATQSSAAAKSNSYGNRSGGETNSDNIRW
jgi:hypothetical protein